MKKKRSEKIARALNVSVQVRAGLVQTCKKVFVKESECVCVREREREEEEEEEVRKEKKDDVCVCLRRKEGKCFFNARFLLKVARD